MPILLESNLNEFAVPILKVLPNLSKNPYFLVKIKLCEVVHKLSYTAIEHACSEFKFQNKVVDILFKLLNDSDQRVRKAACNALVE